MTTFDKVKAKILKTPTARDFTAREVKNFLERYGFVLKNVPKGSHFVYGYPGYDEIVVNIPMHSPIKPTYIDHIRKAILDIEGGTDK